MNLFTKYSPAAIAYAREQHHEICFTDPMSGACGAAYEYDRDHPTVIKDPAQHDALPLGTVTLWDTGSSNPFLSRWIQTEPGRWKRDGTPSDDAWRSSGSLYYPRQVISWGVPVEPTVEEKLATAEAKVTDLERDLSACRKGAADESIKVNNLGIEVDRLKGVVDRWDAKNQALRVENDALRQTLTQDKDTAKKQDLTDVIYHVTGSIQIGDLSAERILRGLRERKWEV